MVNDHLEITINTKGPSLTDFTDKVRDWIQSKSIQNGLLTIFVPHTSCSLLIQENADPDVQRDLESFFRRLVPLGDRLFKHRAEGPDDMPAHIRSALTQTSLSIPIEDAKLKLGIWQGIYLYEHRIHPHTRNVHLHVLG